MASLVQILFELHKYDGSTSRSGFSPDCFQKHVFQSVECTKGLDRAKASPGPICRKLKIEQGLMSVGEIGSVIWDCVRDDSDSIRIFNESVNCIDKKFAWSIDSRHMEYHNRKLSRLFAL